MNNDIFFFFYNLAHQSETFDKVVIFIAETLPYVVIILAGLFLLFYYKVLPSQNPIRELLIKWKEFTIFSFSCISAWALTKILKILFYTPRPFEALPQVSPLFAETGFAFPSAHSTFFMALAVYIFLLNKKIGYVFVFLALLIGFARIIAGVHFPIDILGGFILGVFISYLFAYFSKSV